MMLIHDASGAVVVVSAESVRIVGEGCIVLNARAVYIHNQALTSEQAAIVKRGVTATLDDPAALEDLHGKHDVASVDLPPRDGLGVDGDGVDAHVGKPDGLDEAVTGLQTFGELTDHGGRRTGDGKRRGRSQVKGEVERGFVAHCSSFLRCLKGLVCAITSLSPRRKEPNRPSMNQGAVK